MVGGWNMGKTLKCFYKIQKASELVEWLGKVHAENMANKPTQMDCEVFFRVHQETEKAWGFDLGPDYGTTATKRYVWAPKSVSRVLVNDYYTNQDGPIVLVPRWVMRKW